MLGVSNFVLDMHDLGYARYDHVETSLAPVLKRGVRYLERRAVRSAADIVVVSEYMQSTLTRWGVDGSAATIVPNGYFPEHIQLTHEMDPVD
jgi:hypothetical protein